MAYKNWPQDPNDIQYSYRHLAVHHKALLFHMSWQILISIIDITINWSTIIRSVSKLKVESIATIA